MKTCTRISTAYAPLPRCLTTSGLAEAITACDVRHSRGESLKPAGKAGGGSNIKAYAPEMRVKQDFTP